jgi:hypothetical protein
LFDDWMRSTHPDVPFERYADDIVAHCKTEKQAQQVLESIKLRLARCRVEVHPAKTRIVYCKDDDRRGRHPEEKSTFLGSTFRPRRSKNRWGKFFVNFTPAVSNDAAKKMPQEMRRWHVNLRSDKAIDDLARMWNPVLRGWIQYFGRFYFLGHHVVVRNNRGFKRMACVTLIPKEKSHRLRERIKRLCRRDRTGQSLRELNSWDLLPEEVDRYFVEFQGRAAHCRFRSCRHLHEPGCAIRMAVEAGEIALSRYESYLRLVETTGDSTRR